MLPITLILEESIYDDYIDAFNTVKVELTEESILWILKMSRIVEKLKVANISDYFGASEYLYHDEYEDTYNESDEYHVECEMINIRKNSFTFNCIIKNTNISCESETLNIDNLKKYYDFAKLPIEEMPKYINDEDRTIKEHAKKRLLKGE